MSRDRSRIEILAFLDWYNLLKQVDENEVYQIRERSSLALRQGCRLIEKALGEHHSGYSRVKIRFYGGWSKGFERTEFYRTLISSPELFDPSVLFRSRRIDLHTEFEFGDRLLLAMSNRIHPSLGVHLPNTSRDQGGKRRTEKMVDTALAADLCFSASVEPDAWAIVISNDDDMIPPVMCAEALLRDGNGRAMLVHGGKRLKSTRYLTLEGLVYDCKDFS